MVRKLTENETAALIECHSEPHPDPRKDGYAWRRLKERGVPAYAIIDGMTPTFDLVDDAADAFAMLIAGTTSRQLIKKDARVQLRAAA